jgi:hypothetical protein
MQRQCKRLHKGSGSWMSRRKKEKREGRKKKKRDVRKNQTRINFESVRNMRTEWGEG